MCDPEAGTLQQALQSGLFPSHPDSLHKCQVESKKFRLRAPLAVKTDTWHGQRITSRSLLGGAGL